LIVGPSMQRIDGITIAILMLGVRDFSHLYKINVTYSTTQGLQAFSCSVNMKRLSCVVAVDVHEPGFDT